MIDVIITPSTSHAAAELADALERLSEGSLHRIDVARVAAVDEHAPVESAFPPVVLVGDRVRVAPDQGGGGPLGEGPGSWTLLAVGEDYGAAALRVLGILGVEDGNAVKIKTTSEG